MSIGPPAPSWDDSQRAIAQCDLCHTRWPRDVTRPLQVGEIPDPPAQITILFVGVAPTAARGRHRGSHFYSSATDPLRLGLFAVLDDLLQTDLVRRNRASKDSADAAFHAQHFFFVHTAKVRPISADAPPKAAIVFCARQHLQEEIQILAPRAISFLGKKNTTEAASALCGQRLGPLPVRVSVGRWSGDVVVASQPVRGHDASTRVALESLRNSLAKTPRT